MIKFEIEHLDSMLGDGEKGEGIPKGKLFELVGYEGTYKGRLVRALIASALCDPSHHVVHLTTQPTKAFKEQLQKHLKELESRRKLDGAPINRLHQREITGQSESASTIFLLLSSLLRKPLKSILGDDDLVSDFCQAKKVPTEEQREQLKNILVVIDDLTLLKSQHPALQGSVFIPLLVNYLRALGCTALFVATETSKPISGDDSDDASMKKLFDLRIFTWTVRLGGESKVAITTVPAPKGGKRAFIRELRLKSESDEVLECDRNFELYKDVNDDEANLVQLRFLYQPIDEAAQKHRDELKDVLSAALSHDVLCEHPGVKLNTHLHNQDLLNLIPKDVSIPDTVLLPIDGWWLNTKMAEKLAVLPLDLRFEASQEFTPGLPEKFSSQHSPKLMPFYWNFGFLMMDTEKWMRAASMFRKDATFEGRFEDVRFERYLWQAAKELILKFGSHFSTYSPDSRLINPRDKTSAFSHRDNLPDVNFGFPFEVSDNKTIKNAKALQRQFRAFKKKLPVSVATDGGGEDDTFHIPKSAEELYEAYFPYIGNPVYSWPTFLVACHRVALATGDSREYSFLLADGDPESLNCLVLEMSFSILDTFLEVKGSSDSALAVITSLSKLTDTSKDSHVGLPFLALLVAVQLISEFVEIGNSNEVPVAPPSAGRYWYGSACRATQVYNSGHFEPMRIPGKYSTRGDWYVGYLASSRSYYLGDLALQTLKTDRSSSRRMECGVGLPFSELDDWPTGLTHENVSRKRAVKLGELKLFAPNYPVEKNRPCTLWRESLTNYSAESRVFRSLVKEAIEAFRQIRKYDPAKWYSGVATYEAIINGLKPETKLIRSFKYLFPKMPISESQPYRDLWRIMNRFEGKTNPEN